MVAKARLAIDIAGHRLGVASEGSVGPHPTAVTPNDDLTALVSGHDPARHRLIVRPGNAAEDHLEEGITKAVSNPGALRLAVHAAAQHSSTSQVHVQTDLRAFRSEV